MKTPDAALGRESATDFTTARERLRAYQANPSNDADPWLTAQLQEVERTLAGVAEQAAERLFALGLTSDEVGEFITGTVAESDWSDYAPEDAHIYRAPEDEIPAEDKARLEGYLNAKADEGELARMKAEVERLRERERERVEALRRQRGDSRESW